MASSASSQLDSLFADMQVHALDVNDGFAKLKTALTAESLATKSSLAVSCFVKQPVSNLSFL